MAGTVGESEVSHIKDNLNDRKKFKNEANWLQSERGAIDLSSIMVGVIVTALIGAIIAATVFIVIPWTQDNSTKEQMQSIIKAENAYMGLSSSSSSSLPTGTRPNTFANSVELAKAGLLQQGATYCVKETTDGKGYNAYAKSSTGNIFTVSDKNTTPTIYTGAITDECSYVQTGEGTEMKAPYVDLTPTLTILTYKCDMTSTGTLPMQGELTGVETWNDGTPANTYENGIKTIQKTLEAGVEYKVTFEGTYTKFNSFTSGFVQCLRSVDHWGEQTGVTDATYAFYNALNLSSVPEHIPNSITNMNGMFFMAANFNNPNVSKWNVSNVTDMNNMFAATNFNQPLNSWNVSKVTNMNAMFWGAAMFNQSLENWNVSSVTNMKNMFMGATSFNQNINTWDTSSVTTMSNMFYNASSFNQPLNTWNVGQVMNMDQMFLGATSFNQNLSFWNTHAEVAASQFAEATFPAEYLPPRITNTTAP